MFLSGCNAIIQPSREDIVAANRETLVQPKQMDISVDLLRGEVVLYYTTAVQTESEKASWNGKGTVCYLGNYFAQECITVCEGDTSYKEWRLGWSKTDKVSPVSQINRWLDAVEAGEGIYQKRPVVPADMDNTLAAATRETYCIALYETDVDWNAVTDVIPDTLFGGEELLGNFTGCDVYLFFDTMDLSLEAIYITRVTDEDWIEAAMLISESDVCPEALPTEEEIKEGYLWEEWQRAVSSSTTEE